MGGRMRSVVVAGCGGLGSLLAEHFCAKGLDVVVLDVEESAFSRLREGFSGFAVAGSAAECGVLERAGLGRADLFLAVTSSDSLNIMSAEIAKRRFGVPRVFARVREPSLEGFCASLGIPAVSPVTATAERFLEGIEGPGEGKEGS